MTESYTRASGENVKNERTIDLSRSTFTDDQKAVVIVAQRFKGQRPSEEEWANAQFTEGEPMKAKVAALFDRLESKDLSGDSAEPSAPLPDASDGDKVTPDGLASVRWEAFVEGLDLSDAAREKLKNMLTPEAYQLSFTAYKEMGGTKEPPTLDQIKAEVMTWPVERLSTECEMREQPTLLIVSDSSFDDGIRAMDRNQHYRSAGGDQQSTYVYWGEDSPYVGVPKPKTNCVTITDGVPNPKRLNGQHVRLKEGRDFLTARYEAAGMRHIEAVEMQVLKQRSFIAAQAANDMRLVVDNLEGGDGTGTFLDPESLIKSRLVAYSFFDSRVRWAGFGADFPGDESVYLRGRASAQVMKF